MFRAANFSVPPRMNFFGEVIVICRGLRVRWVLRRVFVASVFFTGVYCVFLYVAYTHKGLSGSRRPMSHFRVIKLVILV